MRRPCSAACQVPLPRSTLAALDHEHQRERPPIAALDRPARGPTTVLPSMSISSR